MPTPPRLTRGEAAALNEEGPALLPENKGEELQKGGVEPITTNVKDGMEAERPQEEENGDQGPHQDEHGWPPVNTTTRPWRSAPPSPPPPGTHHTALGPRSASLLSLQTELLLDLVAEAQSRRLEEQRATFHIPQNPPSIAPAPLRPLEDREQLYSTILSHQCQRMEAQRSEPPLPPGGQELLELLLRVQGGGRMEEQRSRPPTHTC
ncbi:G-protein-signaling modulator 3 isoform X2 [Felis catus]|nr:G-protein-signaling modulator 3 isoform X2 [Felis catus]